MGKYKTGNAKLSQQEQDNIGRAVEQQRSRLDDRLKSRSDYQSRARMSKEDMARGAIDEIAQDVKRISERAGQERSFEDARRYIEKLANTAERKNDR
jgi:hypothetical protein